MDKLMIGICDDMSVFQRKMEQIVAGILTDKQMEYEITLCSSGEELLLIIKNLHLVFLDINMPEMDGIEVGKRIRLINPDCKIIIASSDIDRFGEAFKIKAFRCVTKPFKQAEIVEAITAFIGQNIGWEEMVLYHDGNKFSIPQREIKYIKASWGHVEAMVGDKTFKKDISLRELTKELDKRMFLAVNSRFYVNMFWTRKYKNNMVQGEGFTVPVSRRKRKEFEAARIYFELHHR